MNKDDKNKHIDNNSDGREQVNIATAGHLLIKDTTDKDDEKTIINMRA